MKGVGWRETPCLPGEKSGNKERKVESLSIMLEEDESAMGTCIRGVGCTSKIERGTAG